MGLKGKRALFVQEYLKDLNAAAAYRRAGYKAKNDHAAAVGASKLVTNGDIAAAIAAGRKAVAVEVKLDAAYVLDGLREVAERCMQRAPVCDLKGEQVQDEDGRSVWTFNAKGAVAAFGLLGRHLGLFDEKKNDPNLSVAVTCTVDLGKLSLEELKALRDMRHRAFGPSDTAGGPA